MHISLPLRMVSCTFVFAGNTIGNRASVLLINCSDTTVSRCTFSHNTVMQLAGPWRLMAAPWRCRTLCASWLLLTGATAFL
jgi:hypothetical protein